MNTVNRLIATLHNEELALLQRLRVQRKKSREKPKQEVTTGARIADAVAAMMGSWPFIIGQSIILFIWIVLNITAYVQRWDPYPFILLNLALSFQAAYAAPFIMMSQNRQASIDRRAAEHDYDINIKAELEIELLHQKVDLLREKEIVELLEVIKELRVLLAAKS
ncbi:MAG TPA: DUF1003 domain-containing protein [Rhizomicrobium sp.]|jgi:uncharacterized membrane protein|nr:DUF1003 domain-containing protein [Rhizomicrobium sp.]